MSKYKFIYKNILTNAADKYQIINIEDMAENTGYRKIISFTNPSHKTIDTDSVRRGFVKSETVNIHHISQGRAKNAFYTLLDYCYKSVHRNKSTVPVALSVRDSVFNNPLSSASVESLSFVSKPDVFRSIERLLKVHSITDLLLIYSSFTIEVEAKDFVATYEVFTQDRLEGLYKVIVTNKPNNDESYGDLANIKIKFGTYRDTNVCNFGDLYFIYKKYIDNSDFTDVSFVCNCHICKDDLQSIVFNELVPVSKYPNNSLLLQSYLQQDSRIKLFNDTKNNLIDHSLLDSSIFFSLRSVTSVSINYYKDITQRSMASGLRSLCKTQHSNEFEFYLVDNNNSTSLRNISKFADNNTSAKTKKLIEKINEKLEYMAAAFDRYLYAPEGDNSPISVRDPIEIAGCYLVYKGRKLKYVHDMNDVYTNDVFLEVSFKNLKKVNLFLLSVLVELEKQYGGYLLEKTSNTIPKFPTSNKDLIEYSLMDKYQLKLNPKKEVDFNETFLKEYKDNFREATSCSGFSLTFLTLPFTGGITRELNLTLVSLYTLRAMYFSTKGCLLKAMLDSLPKYANIFSIKEDGSGEFTFLNKVHCDNLYIPHVGYLNEFLRNYKDSPEVVSISFIKAIYIVYNTLYKYINAFSRKETDYKLGLFIKTHASFVENEEPRLCLLYNDLDVRYPLYLISRMSVFSKTFNLLFKKALQHNILVKI